MREEGLEGRAGASEEVEDDVAGVAVEDDVCKFVLGITDGAPEARKRRMSAAESFSSPSPLHYM